MKKITVLKLNRPNRGRFHFCVVYDIANWTGRSLRAKMLLNSDLLYSRNATSDELEEISLATRETCFFYETWEHLVRDEALYGIDANFFLLQRKIRQFEKKH